MKDIGKLLEKGMSDVLKESHIFDEFIAGTQRELHFKICNVPIVLYREAQSLSVYYEVRPNNLQAHVKATLFMSDIVPYLQNAIKKKDEEKLFAPGSKVKATPRYT